jgi:hypothetical protein
MVEPPPGGHPVRLAAREHRGPPRGEKPSEETPLDRVIRLCSLLAETAAPGTFLLNKACKTITKARKVIKS